MSKIDDVVRPEKTPIDPNAKVPAYSWYALGVLVLVYVLNFIDRQILSILANDIKADLGVEDDYLGFCMERRSLSSMRFSASRSASWPIAGSAFA